MISVIVPLMGIPPYDSQIEDLLKDLEKQTATHEVIVVEQPIERYIRKNDLLNEGYEESQGDFIWHCDADFLLPDVTLLERMADRVDDVIYPMFYSRPNKGFKIADGAPFMRRNVIERYGALNGDLHGIGYVTFPFLAWCLTNTELLCSREFQIELNDKPFRRLRGKQHTRTVKELQPLAKRLKAELMDLGVWPQ
jgi:glycosyltransferase involved in cell wall biosynthesis